ncbi:MAG: hypothetical protein FMNOHCHN_03805 [Ignavibacteriaceae bacterium]|nr:hypothetical protein [Ignavibacteriaceae bacterium]
MSNTLDSRLLDEELADLLEQFEDWKSNLTDEQIHELAKEMGCEVIDLEEDDFRQEWDGSNADRITAIQELESEVNSSEWGHGIEFIKDSYFAEYAEQLAEDIGAIDRNANWPLNHINWELAADELKSDYTSVEFDGETYWYRS